MNTVRPVAVARVSLPIRRPRREVFLALTDPEMLCRFWPRSAGAQVLETGLTTQWYLGEVPVTVTCVQIVEDQLIRLTLSTGARIMLTLDRFDDGGTVVHYCECGFGAEGDTASQEVSRVTSAAALMLSDLKALLERGAETRARADSQCLPSAA
ncbi:SRPBCC domain-containing protein [Pseudooceanicola onchidii]|uniref:SRPBCC domain-containing protein n=1 Tax=Pseudooceanicola onchidii TaxID=2562279 RepID=UPI00145B2621|nr:SRPBCC domain-containing protein [Pseudooceanicola onchidii]